MGMVRSGLFMRRRLLRKAGRLEINTYDFMDFRFTHTGGAKKEKHVCGNIADVR